MAGLYELMMAGSTELWQVERWWPWWPSEQQEQSVLLQVLHGSAVIGCG